MAKDLSKMLSKINDVAKESFEKANSKKIVILKDEQLLDHPLNEEDLSYTEDIEEHIKNEGFRYPIIVTSMGVPDNAKDRYYIVSGHRSRLAGRNLGRTEFPCIIEDYANEIEVYHALLTGNTRRNYDPLDLAGRYKKWDKYLDMINFKGNRAEKIGKSLGISAKQAEKYKAFNKIIPEFWELVRAGAAKDGLYILAPKTEDEQRKIYDFFLICNPQKETYTVKVERDIINAWICGARNYEDYCSYKEQREQAKSILAAKEEKTAENVLPDKEKDKDSNDAADINTDENVNKQESVLSKMNEGTVERKIEGHNNNAAANEEFKNEEKRKYKEEKLSAEDFDNSQQATINAKDKSSKDFSETNIVIDKKENREEPYQNADEPDWKKEDATELLKQLSGLQMKIKIDHNYKTKDEATEVMEAFARLSMELMTNMEVIRDKYGIYDEYNESSEKIYSYIQGVPFQ